VGLNEQIFGELMVTFRTIKFIDQSFFVIQCMYMYLLSRIWLQVKKKNPYLFLNVIA